MFLSNTTWSMIDWICGYGIVYVQIFDCAGVVPLSTSVYRALQTHHEGRLIPAQKANDSYNFIGFTSRMVTLRVSLSSSTRKKFKKYCNCCSVITWSWLLQGSKYRNRVFRKSESQGQCISWYMVNLICTLVWAIVPKYSVKHFKGCFCGGVCVSVCVWGKRKTGLLSTSNSKVTPTPKWQQS